MDVAYGGDSGCDVTALQIEGDCSVPEGPAFGLDVTLNVRLCCASFAQCSAQETRVSNAGFKCGDELCARACFVVCKS